MIARISNCLVLTLVPWICNRYLDQRGSFAKRLRLQTFGFCNNSFPNMRFESSSLLSIVFFPKTGSRKLRFSIIVSLFFLLLLGLLDVFGADLKVIDSFFHTHRWELGNQWFFKLLYDWGPYPSLILGLSSLFAGVYLLVRTKSCRKCIPFVYPFLTLVVGPGLLVNAIFKDHWGRPRPRQLELYGEDQSYSRFWQPNFGNGSKSFPSGHASVGFHLCCLAFLHKNPFRKTCLTLGLLWGSLMGLARILQGGHYVTDVVASGGLVLLTCILLCPEETLRKLPKS